VPGELESRGQGPGVRKAGNREKGRGDKGLEDEGNGKAG